MRQELPAATSPPPGPPRQTRNRHTTEARRNSAPSGPSDGFLLVQIAMFLVLVTIHFGLLIGGYGHPAAGTTESVIAVVLLFGLLLTWTPPPWRQRAATAAQSFGALGVLVGLFTFALGIGPRTILDLSLNLILLLTLIAGLVLTKRGAGHEQPVWMAVLW